MSKSVVTISCTVIITIIAIGSVLLLGGDLISNIDNNKDELKKHDTRIIINYSDISDLKVNAKVQTTLQQNTFEVITSVSNKLDDIQKVQNIQAIDIAVLRKESERKNTDGR